METPIVLLCHRRPEHLGRLLTSLAKCPEAKDTALHVYSDGAADAGEAPAVSAVRERLQHIEGFGSVRVEERPEHWGLSRNVIEGVNSTLSAAEQCIVVEDDLEVSPGFLDYMRCALDFYRGRGVGCISGYTPAVELPEAYPYSTYALRRNCSWGWATWARVWKEVDWAVADYPTFVKDRHARASFDECGNDLSPMLKRWHDGELDSWSIRFCYHLWRRGQCTIYPRRSLVRNAGADGSGSNVGSTARYDSPIAPSLSTTDFVPGVAPDPVILRSFKAHYDTSTLRHLRNWLSFRV